MKVAFAEGEETVGVSEFGVEFEECFFAAVGRIAGGVGGDSVLEVERVFANFGQASLQDEARGATRSVLYVKGELIGLRHYFSNDGGCVDCVELERFQRITREMDPRLLAGVNNAVTGQETLGHNELC